MCAMPACRSPSHCIRLLCSLWDAHACSPGSHPRGKVSVANSPSLEAHSSPVAEAQRQNYLVLDGRGRSMGPGGSIHYCLPGNRMSALSMRKNLEEQSHALHPPLMASTQPLLRGCAHSAGRACCTRKRQGRATQMVPLQLSNKGPPMQNHAQPLSTWLQGRDAVGTDSSSKVHPWLAGWPSSNSPAGAACSQPVRVCLSHTLSSHPTHREAGRAPHATQRPLPWQCGRAGEGMHTPMRPRDCARGCVVVCVCVWWGAWQMG